MLTPAFERKASRFANNTCSLIENRTKFADAGSETDDTTSYMSLCGKAAGVSSTATFVAKINFILVIIDEA